MISSYVSYKNSTIHYRYSGAGDQLILCFHGYGENAESFDFLENHLPKSFQIISVDLIYHGKTSWKEKGFSVGDLEKIIDIIGESFPRARNHKIILLGFSMGGRICLSLFEVIPQKIEKIILLAPDGLKVNFWYWLATQTLIGNKLFSFTMKHPGWFFGFLKVLNKLNLVNTSIFKFVSYYVEYRQVRMDLYNRWTACDM